MPPKILWNSRNYLYSPPPVGNTLLRTIVPDADMSGPKSLYKLKTEKKEKTS
jgi:hypothetical protein